MKKKLIGIVALVLLICSTALALGLPPKYIETLDLFLARLEIYQDNSNYIQILNEFSTQLDTLKPRYSSSGNVPAMIDYLVSGIEDLKNKKLATDIDDEFFRNINNLISNGLGSSTSSSTTSSSSGGGNTNTNTPFTYSWQYGSWGVCSKECGGGTRIRTSSCERSDGVIVTNSYCSGTPTISETCNTEVCSSSPSSSSSGGETPSNCSAYTLYSCPNNGSCSRCSNEMYRLDSCTGGYTINGNTCDNCIAYTLNSCPIGGNCGSCSNGKFKLNSCTNGYTLSGNICVDCSAYTLNSCPTGGNCDTCANGKFKLNSCTSGYFKSENSCISVCPAQTSANYSVPELNNGASRAVERSVSISGGTAYYQRTFTCNDRNLSYGSETVSRVNCNAGYAQSGQACVIVCNDNEAHNHSVDDYILEIYKEMGRNFNTSDDMRESVCWYDSRRLVGNSLRCALLNDAANYTGNVTAFKSVMTKAKQLYDKDCK